ncbi:YjgN family protein [uncultured Roseibium sp.]|uniref:YjgN family protein n=1 Tax=uncultured Roseibium sp. TaxID=1936171 RepID=UPI00262BE8A8|nr:YjgN family protein [uncultured Roseibium sp.]
MDTTPQPTPVTHPFQFNGRAGEYFGIWIVNLLLTIVTIGIYSAWAKVRHQRYFYGNTVLDGHNFEYHARPINILIGRIIVIIALVIYQALAFISPALAGILILIYLGFVPWLFNRSIRFNARVTSYRNLRFNFEPSYWKAFLVFLVMPMVAVLTAGVLAPVASRMHNAYIGNRLRYGNSSFKTDPNLGDLYANWGMTILVMFLGFIVIGIISVAVALLSGIDFSGIGTAFESDDAVPTGFAFSFLLFGVLIYTAPVLAFIFYAAGVRNIAFNSTTLNENRHRLRSSLSRRRYLWILLSNLVVILFTLGLMRPWAAVRTWRYFADQTQLQSLEPLDTFVGDNIQEGSAAAAEFTAMEGIEFGL